MKAAICREFGAPLSIEEITLDSVKADQVAVTLKAVAICHSDILFAEGAWGGHLPSVYGHEAAGVITDLGEEVTDFARGDRVIVTLMRACGTCGPCDHGHEAYCEGPFDRVADSPITDMDGVRIEQGMATGAFAEGVVVHRSQIAKIPDEMPMDEASLLSCGAITGIGAVMNAAKLPAGKTCVVVGAGGVGLNTIQGAAIAGAGQIIALDIDPVKLDGASEFGATAGVLATDADAADQIRALTHGRGADFVFVTVGAVQAYQSALDYLAMQGELIMVGMTESGKEMRLEPVNLAAMGQVMRGTKMGDTVLSRDIPKLLDWVAEGKLNLGALISNRYTLDQINEALEDTKAGKSRRNVILFD